MNVLIVRKKGSFEELSEFKHGTVIGCTVHEILSLEDIPQSTLSGIIGKWTRLGTAETQP